MYKDVAVIYYKSGDCELQLLKVLCSKERKNGIVNDSCSAIAR